MKIFMNAITTPTYDMPTLISIGLVSEDGRAFYAEFSDYDESQLDVWSRENIINNLTLKAPNEGEQEPYIKSCVDDNVSLTDKFNIEMRGCWLTVRQELLSWLRQFNATVEIWGDYIPYYWSLFCGLLGDYELPQYVENIPFDICSLFRFSGIDLNIDREKYGYNLDMNVSMKFIKSQRYNALWRAYVTRACFNKLTSNQNLRGCIV